MSERDPGKDPAPAQSRERHEPEELRNPVPLGLLALFVALIGWGFWYYFSVPPAPMQAGDSRTPVSAAAGPAAETAVDGSAVYAGNCASCHQGNGKGVPGAFPPLDGARWVTSDTVAIPIQILLHGVNGEISVGGETYNGVMPAFPQLSDAEIAAVLTHERSAWSNDAAPIDAEAVAREREATSDRGGPWQGGKELEERYGAP